MKRRIAALLLALVLACAVGPAGAPVASATPPDTTAPSETAAEDPGGGFIDGG